VRLTCQAGNQTLLDSDPSISGQPVNLDDFRTLHSSAAMGAAQKARLMNHTALTVDTSWWLRYRSPGNPDFGDVFPQLINIVEQPATCRKGRPPG
jgi:hypothetical protein